MDEFGLRGSAGLCGCVMAGGTRRLLLLLLLRFCCALTDDRIISDRFAVYWNSSNPR